MSGMNTDILKQLYIDELKSVKDIAQILQVPEAAVYRALVKYNIKRTKEQINIVRARTNQSKYNAKFVNQNKENRGKGASTYKAKINEDELSEKITQMFISENQTCTEIARNLNLVTSFVQRRVRRLGLVKTPEQLAAKKEEIVRRRAKQLCVNKNIDYLSEELLRKLFLDENLSIHEIAKRYGKSSVVVWNKIKKYKIEKTEELKKEFNARKAQERVETREKNSGTPHLWQKHIPEDVREIINNEIKFTNFVKKIKTNTKGIAEKLNIDQTVVINRCNKWDLWKYIKKYNCLSYEENEVLDYIKSFYHGIIETPNRSVLDGKHIDIYLPQKRIGIEYNGSYWHRTDAKRWTPKQKTQLAISKNIRLIHIYDYEWYNHKENVKQFLYWLIHKKGRKFFNIKDLKLKEIDKKTYFDFLEHNHLFGGEHHVIYKTYGLFTKNNELISVSGFAKSYRKQYDWDWRRFCIKYGYVIEGGAPEKFLEEFSKDHHGVLVDYQQMDRFPTISSERMGFKKLRWNEGFVSVDTIHKQFKYTRHRFIPEDGLTSLETMKKYGYDVEVPNAGTITWIKEI